MKVKSSQPAKKGFVRSSQKDLSSRLFQVANDCLYQGRNFNIVIKILSSNLGKLDINAEDKSCKDGKTLLDLAIVYRNKEAVIMLIKAGADVNFAGNQYGITPLQLAALNGFTEIVEELIKANADVNATDNNGNTSLHWATTAGTNQEEEIVEKLREAGAKTVANKLGDLPLFRREGCTSSHIVYT